ANRSFFCKSISFILSACVTIVIPASQPGADEVAVDVGVGVSPVGAAGEGGVAVGALPIPVSPDCEAANCKPDPCKKIPPATRAAPTAIIINPQNLALMKSKTGESPESNSEEALSVLQSGNINLLHLEHRLHRPVSLSFI